MLIWLLVIGLIVAFAAIGYLQGAIRTLVSLVGFILAATLAVPLASLAKPLVPLMKVTNPVWAYLLPPIIVFVVIILVFTGLSFYVHRLVYLYYKYKTDDLHFRGWERMNKGLGASVGVIIASGYAVILGVLIYVGGYLTVQVASAEPESAVLKYLNQARNDLKSTGMEKTAAAFDPTPESYYVASDIVGLVYHNPLLQSRLSAYPPFLSLAQRAEFQDIASDPEYNNMLQTQADISVVVNHPKTQAIINNQEIIQQLQQIDLKDLRDYLRSGNSVKYEDERILGRWRVDVGAVMNQAKRKKPNISSVELILLKRVATTVLAGTTLIATTDNKVYVKFQPTEEMQMLAQAAAAQAQAAAAQAQAAPQTGMSPDMAARYGLSRPTAPAPGAATPPPAPMASADFSFNGEGTWEDKGGKYEISIADPNGKQETVGVYFENERMYMDANGLTLVFVKDA